MQDLNNKDQKAMDDRYITIKVGFLEHLLNCLANQKYAHEIDIHSSLRYEIQKAIDSAYHEGRKMLSDSMQSNSRGCNMALLRTQRKSKDN